MFTDLQSFLLILILSTFCVPVVVLILSLILSFMHPVNSFAHSRIHIFTNWPLHSSMHSSMQDCTCPLIQTFFHSCFHFFRFKRESFDARPVGALYMLSAASKSPLSVAASKSPLSVAVPLSSRKPSSAALHLRMHRSIHPLLGASLALTAEAPTFQIRAGDEKIEPRR